jgi:hypothetical protein
MADKRDDTRDFESDEQAEGIGGIVDELASSWLVGERVVHAQQTALSALGLPSGSQFESLTLRVRTIFHRIEELEDELDRVTDRVAALEKQLAAKKPAAKKPAAKK